MAEPLTEYLLELIEATRRHPDIVLGASTRAALGLYRACQAAAFVAGRDYAIPDDVKQLAIPVLAHRLLSKRWSQGLRDDAATTALTEILEKTTVPV